MRRDKLIHWLQLTALLSVFLITNIIRAETSSSNGSIRGADENASSIDLSRNNTAAKEQNEKEEEELDSTLYSELMKTFNMVSTFRYIFIAFGSFITPCGILLNITCIVIFAKSKLFRNSSFPYYVYVMSTVDSLNILIRFAIPQLIESSLRYTLKNKYNVSEFDETTGVFEEITNQIASPVYCSVFIYVYNCLTLISVWLMVAVSVERWLVIAIPIQTKRMLRIRAACIISFVFVSIVSLNVFDLAPGLYIGPNWYSNLTLLCERDDMVHTTNNVSSMYKRLGPIEFNTDRFVLVRSLLQSIVPFVIVLVFNSLIIYNFKKIKSTAMSGTLSASGAAAVTAAGRSKAQSVVSMNSGNSLANISLHQSGGDGNDRPGGSLKCDGKRSSRNHQRSRRAFTQPFVNTHQLRIPTGGTNRSCSNKSITTTDPSRSPSPFNMSSSRALTPLTNHSVTASSITPSTLMTVNQLTGPNSVKQQPFSSTTTPSYLAPPGHGRGATVVGSGIIPTELSSENSSQNTNSDANNKDRCKGNESNGDLSLSNRTESTTVQKSSGRGCSERNESTAGDHSSPSLAAASKTAVNGQASSALLLMSPDENLTFVITNHVDDTANGKRNSGGGGGGRISTTTQTPSRSVSFRHRMSNVAHHHTGGRHHHHHHHHSKIKLNRETDIMLIVLSIFILFSQLPFTVLYYLLYYQGMVVLENDSGYYLSIYHAVRTPLFIFSIRMFEMFYFSLNFFFYISLSASLRREIKTYVMRVVSRVMALKRCFGIGDDRRGSAGSAGSRAAAAAARKESMALLKNRSSASLLTTKNEGENQQNGKSRNRKSAVNGGNEGRKKGCLFGRETSGGEHIDYLDRLRSISPLHRPSFFFTESKRETKLDAKKGTVSSSNSKPKDSGTKKKTPATKKPIMFWNKNYRQPQPHRGSPSDPVTSTSLNSSSSKSVREVNATHTNNTNSTYVSQQNTNNTIHYVKGTSLTPVRIIIDRMYMDEDLNSNQTYEDVNVVDNISANNNHDQLDNKVDSGADGDGLTPLLEPKVDQMTPVACNAAPHTLCAKPLIAKNFSSPSFLSSLQATSSSSSSKRIANSELFDPDMSAITTAYV